MQAVHKGVTIDPWAVAVFDARVNDGDRIGFQLMECCNRQGLVRCPVTSSLLRCTMISYIQCLFLIYQLIPPYDFPDHAGASRSGERATKCTEHATGETSRANVRSTEDAQASVHLGRSTNRRFQQRSLRFGHLCSLA
jgi:hypothetical protein